MLSLTWLGDAGTQVLLAGTARHSLVRLEPADSAWRREDIGPSVDLVAGLALSPAFATDRTAFAAGTPGRRALLARRRPLLDRAIAGREDAFVSGLALSPDFARDRTLYAATNVGLYASSDAGQSWYQPSSMRVPVRTVAIIPLGSSDEGSAWRLMIASDGEALLASDDGGRTLKPLGPGFPNSEIISLTVSPDYALDHTLFVGTSSEGRGSDGGRAVLWRSTDSGSRWQRWLVESSPRDILPVAIRADHAVSGTVFVGLGGSVLSPRRNAEEVRGGEQRPIWDRVAPGKEVGAVTGLAAALGKGTVAPLFASTNAGMFLSRDGARRSNRGVTVCGSVDWLR